MNSSRAVLGAIFLALFGMAACTEQTPAPALDPLAVLQAIPVAKAAQYEHIGMRSWKNPYLIVRTDGVALLDTADNAEIHLKTDELLPALAKLPASNWPYGRVVAVSEMGVLRNDQDNTAIRRNRGIVGGILHDANIAIEWVPPA